ncbi:hypothetical protein BH09BAC3_BH09BAC3_02860 [soil metagenome]
MDEKISLKALEDYSDDYASKVTASFFSAKEKITGPEILKICDVNQINLFVIRELLHVWKHESIKLKSPFFDYTAKPVADALAKFQNLLSNHISISRENFQPLLKKAVHQTLFLILDPYDFYAETLDNGLGGQLNVEDLKNDIKYVKINLTPLERLLRSLDEKSMTTISGNEAFALLDRILEEVNFTPEDIDDYVTKFSAIMPLEIEKLYEKKIFSIHTPPKTETPHIEAAKKELEKLEPVKIETKPTQAPLVVETEPVRRQEEKKPESVAPVGTKVPQPVAVAEEQVKRKKIRDTMTINQKFMFTKILFNGDFELFSTAVERLDEFDNMTQATSYIANNYSEWNREGEEYLEFVEIVEKHFN